MKICFKMLVVFFAVSLLSGCAGTNDRPVKELGEFPDVYEVEPELGGKILRRGENVPQSLISKITKGKSQDEVNVLLGRPFLMEEAGEKSWWFYNINLPLLREGDDEVVCQYRVSFSNNEVLSSAWRRPVCRNIYLNHFEDSGLSYSGDALFSFDSYELTLGGKREMDEVVSLVEENFNNPLITVIGHTDRIGSYSYNVSLSEDRANSVSDYLVSRGVSRDGISVAGRGDGEPLVYCSGDQVTQELKRCLQPNRRVHITISGN